MKRQEQSYSVWVGGVEVNDTYLSHKEANRLAEQYRKEGYDDVAVRKER